MGTSAIDLRWCGDASGNGGGAAQCTGLRAEALGYVAGDITGTSGSGGLQPAVFLS